MRLPHWTATDERCERPATSACPPEQPPAPAPCGPRLERPQVQGVVVRNRRTGTPTQFCLEFVRDTTGVKVSRKGLPAPLGRHRAQHLVGQLLLCRHAEIVPSDLAAGGPSARAGGHCGSFFSFWLFSSSPARLARAFYVQPMHHLLSLPIFPLQVVFPRPRDPIGTDFARMPVSDAEA